MDPIRDGDPYSRPAFSLRNRLARAFWGAVWLLLFRPSPRPLHAWRSFLLRCFGAKLGPRCHIYPRARIWAPWNLCCEDRVTIADDAEVYNPSLVQLDSHAIISQHAYLCGASHDYQNPAFPLISAPIRIGRYAWVAARAIVCMGTTIGEGAVLGIGSITVRNLAPWSVYAGAPARKVKARTPHDGMCPHG